MNRLISLQQNLIAQKQTLVYDHFAKLSTIDKQQFKQVLYGRNWHWRQRCLNIIKDNKDKYRHGHLQQSTRAQLRQTAAQLLFFTKQKVHITLEMYLQDPNILSLASSAYCAYDAGFSIKNGVHIFLYMKTIFNLGRQRHQKFVQAAVNFKDIGCFGLTQLYHGSNVRGILTQAHYDHQRKQFIINTPSKQGMKFWIGAASQIANMSVIWAQLFIDGKCYGVHAYIVPIRDRKTHKLLPGVLIGDCGPKNGVNCIDNGFILLDNVRIPFENQLDRISGVNQEGKFFSIVQGQDKRFGTQLGALSGGRFMVAHNSTIMAMSALTIAIRYICIRRQFNNKPGQVENLLIQYPLTKRRMMPLLAQAIVYSLGNYQIIAQWDKNLKNILDPTNKVMQELHAISATVKPKSGWFATQCIRQCRQMCGGHGYSSFNKLGVLYNDNDIQNTWQGDNNILYQQATKYLLDNLQKVMKGKDITSPLLQFLNNPPQQEQIILNQQNLMNLNFGIKFIQYKIYSKLQAMVMKMMELKQKDMGNFDIWNNSQVFLGKVIGLAFGDLFYLDNAIKKINEFKKQQNRKIMQIITKLWLLKVFRYDEFVDFDNHKLIQRLMMKLCKVVANQSLGLLQSLSTDDIVIGAPFACPEGKGMEKYISFIQNSKKMEKKPEWWKILKQKNL